MSPVIMYRKSPSLPILSLLIQLLIHTLLLFLFHSFLLNFLQPDTLFPSLSFTKTRVPCVLIGLIRKFCYFPLHKKEQYSFLT